MGKTVEELLKVRYKAIADYPESRYKVGDLLKVDGKYIFYNGVNHVSLITPGQYPHLFKRLEWWEDRKPEDMPEYVKNDAGVYKVPKWDYAQRYGGWYFTNEHPMVGMNITTYGLQPATESEYLAAKTPTQ